MPLQESMYCIPYMQWRPSTLDMRLLPEMHAFCMNKASRLSSLHRQRSRHMKASWRSSCWALKVGSEKISAHASQRDTSDCFLSKTSRNCPRSTSDEYFSFTFLLAGRQELFKSLCTGFGTILERSNLNEYGSLQEYQESSVVYASLIWFALKFAGNLRKTYHILSWNRLLCRLQWWELMANPPTCFYSSNQGKFCSPHIFPLLLVQYFCSSCLGCEGSRFQCNLKWQQVYTAALVDRLASVSCMLAAAYGKLQG